MDADEVLHLDDPGTADAWQPASTLATHLGVAERTIRARAAKGAGVERTRGPGGRAFYRATSTNGSDRQPASGGSGSVALVERLEGRLAEVRREHAAEVNELRDRIEAAAVEAERQRAAAEAANVAREQALRGANRLAAQLEQQRADLAAEKQRARNRERAAALAAACRWWSPRKRRRLLLEAAGLADEPEAQTG